MKRAITALLAMTLTLTLSAGAADKAEKPAKKEKVSAKNIYYEPPQTSAQAPNTPPPPTQQQAAVRFWVDLHPRSAAAPLTVTADYRFESGDRTRFRVGTNVDCFVYVAYEGSMGDRALLYPSSAAGLDNRVRRHVAKVMPSTDGYFTMDEHTGDEHVVIVISPTRIPDLDQIVRERDKSKSVSFSAKENTAFDAFLKKTTGKTTGASTKNIVYEPENGGQQVGSYYAQPRPGFTEPVIINVTLKHVAPGMGGPARGANKSLKEGPSK